MKTRKILTILGLAAALFVTGCNGSGKDKEKGTSAESKSEETASKEENHSQGEEEDTTPILEGDFQLADCITLGDYKGLKLTRSVEEVTDQDVDVYLASLMDVEEVTDKNATVQIADTVNLAYEGTRDGVAFEGGTSKSHDLVIGSKSFIEGFEEGMLGMKVGESRDLNLTFPDDYKSADLRGAAVVFHVTVNKISRPKEMTDAWVAEKTGNEYQTAEAYRDYVRENLETNKQNTALQAMRQDAWNQIEESCEFLQLPSSYVEEGKDEFETSITQEAAYSGMSLEDYITAYGLTKEVYESRKEQYGRATAKSRLMLEALQKAEGLSKEDEEYQEGLEKLTQSYGVDAETLIASYGEDTVEQYIMTSRILDRVLGYAEITEETK